MTEKLFDKVAIIGLGLIGSSIARGIKKHGLSTTVIGFDASPDVPIKPSPMMATLSNSFSVMRRS
ncbi:MAG: hypothetical protein AAGF09_06735, partial [Pseudomonadota bacterium]